MLVEFSKKELLQVTNALKDSGLEFTENARLYRKITDILDKLSVNDIK